MTTTPDVQAVLERAVPSNGERVRIRLRHWDRSYVFAFELGGQIARDVESGIPYDTETLRNDSVVQWEVQP